MVTGHQSLGMQLGSRRPPFGRIHVTTWYELVAGRGRAPRRQALLFVLSVLVVLLALNGYAPAAPAPLERVLASLIIIAALVPTWRWLRGRESGVPFMVFWGWIYAGYFAAPVFLLERFSRAYYISDVIAHESIERVLMLALLGVVAALAGYYGPVARRVASLVPRLQMRWAWPPRYLVTLGVVLGATGLVAYFVLILVSLPLWLVGIIGFISDLSLMAIVYLLLLRLADIQSGASDAFLWLILVPLRFMLGVTTGATYQGLVVVAALLLTYATIRRRLPTTWIIAGLGLFLVVRAIQVPFREVTWQEGRAATSVLERLSTMTEIAGRAVTEPDFFSAAWQIGLSRISYLMTFAEVVGLVPDYVPFWMGETYKPIVWKLVPRVIYLDKPMENVGQAFGHRVGFLSADDFVTAYNLPQVIEFYVNFGVVGLGLGMFSLGVFYRVLQAVFVHPQMGLGAMMAVLYISLKLLLIESNLSLVVGGIIQAGVLLVVLHAGVSIFAGASARRRPA